MRTGTTRAWAAWAAVLLCLGCAAASASGGARSGILANGDFADGTEGWEFVTGADAVAAFEIDTSDKPGDGDAAKVTVNRAPFTAWQVCLQSAVRLAGGKRYRVSFDIVADAKTSFDVCVQGADPPYRILQLATVGADASARRYAFITPPVPADGLMRVAFWFGNADGRTFWVDRVAVQELTPEELSWLESEPEGFRNGDFSAGPTGWELRVHDGAVAELSIDPTPRLGEGNCARVEVTRSTDTSWHVQLMQIFAVKAGRDYAATFHAVADRKAEIRVGFQVPPPDNEVLHTQAVRLGTEPATYVVSSGKTRRDSEMKLTFHFSAAGEGTFWIDKVSVAELEGTGAPKPEQPAEGGN